MTPKELDELLTVCKKHGVSVFTDGHVRIAFDRDMQPVNAKALGGMLPVKPGQRPMTDMERFLFAATEGFVDDEDAYVPVKPE